MIKTNPPAPEWLKRAKQHTRGRGPKIHLGLKNILLNIGGWAACIPAVEPDLEKLKLRGRKFPGKSIMMKGEPCRCHSNSAACWDENRELCKICTGYALSRDGMWRQHSWILTNQGKIVETTEKRVQYFGYIMTLEECELFLDSNF
jgi:hypothetical protein